MSFDTLPTDVYDRITSHLAGDYVRGKTAPVALGKTLSLVCKTLRPIGQALVWREIDLDYAEFAKSSPEVFAKFELYRHLHPLVLSLFTKNENCTSPSSANKTSRIILQLLQHCPDLRWVCVNLPLHTKPALTRQVFEATSKLENLLMLGLTGTPIKLNPEAINHLHVGFPRLESLAICVSIPSSDPDALEYSGPLGSRKRPLRRLTLEVLDIEPNSEQIPQIFILLATSLGVGARLDEFRLAGPMFHSLTLQWLTFPHIKVREMSFACDPSDLEEKFSDLLFWLPKLDRILTLSINARSAHGEDSENSIKAPVSLARFLSTVPFSIHLVHLGDVYFFGSLSWPETRRKPSELALVTGPSVKFNLKTSHLSPQVLVTLKKMKDRRGVLRWHRVIET